MKSTKQVLEEGLVPAALVRAVIRQTGKENLPDICNHGADGGFSGFTYYSDTVPFYRRNRGEILELAKQQADDFGQGVMEMIAGFRCLRQQESEHKRALLDEIGRALYGRVTEEETQVANALAWYAAEEVARAFCDED